MATNNAGGIARALNPEHYLPVTYRLTVAFCVAATVSRLLVTWCMYRLSWSYGTYIVVYCIIGASSQVLYTANLPGHHPLVSTKAAHFKGS